ncbi:uncharacterized protein LAESUDRAFT_463993 [Laetiporus sulphureus 93-53]|uniref:F-box domain-containing protein n=1 Tax=Laetiporus sulphureus 93-53 TaxID=1314785 RepID=A0A165G6F8_9APHY|nr:uncharacterized protein LAESUDRAFT_463993 [Laetiporus sulphureus 93-53]KZT09891.1 hypothetical protein LAESUDRAFT_463993 [Laetiporus sulphureus 93-53]
MLVCHHWKEIASEIRELWNGVETYWHDKDHALLERSGQGPLKVLARSEPLCQDAVGRALQNVEHSSRIQELYWTNLSNCENSKYLGMPVPSLKSLMLQNGHNDSVPDGSFELFDCHTPCLERLSLSHLYWLPSNAFAKLTLLALDRCHVTKSRAKVRSLLAGTPNLVDLILRYVADSNVDRYVGAETEPADMKPVSLVRLRRLLIERMWTDDIDYIFQDARLNGDLSVSIKNMNWYDDEQRLLEVVSSWSLNALKQPKELHFQQHVAIVTGASSGLRFEVRRSRALEHWTRLDWSRILPLSCISHLCTFEQDARRLPGLERVRNILRQMTALETLSVNIEGLTKVIDALTLFREPTGPPFCPALTTLRIAIWEDSDSDIILDSVLPHRAQLGVKHLYIGLIDCLSHGWEALQDAEHQLHGKFESVNCEPLWVGETYGIKLPPVCDEEAHALWPPWI